MIKNIYKSYITTIMGTLFLAADIFYAIFREPNFKILIGLAVIGIVLIFLNDKYAKKIIDKILNIKI